MRLILFAVFLIVQILGSKTCNAQGPGTFQWTNGAPNNNPGLSGAKFAVDKNTYRWYEWVSGTSWVESGDRIQRISGCSAPNYTPTIHSAYFVVNGCTNPEFYYWNGTAWKLLNGGGGATYTAGSGIAISGTNVISADTSILATQYDISQLGVTWPLLAPNGTPTAPTYSFSENPTGGLMFEDASVKIVAGGDEGDLIVPIIIKGSNSFADAGGDVRIESGSGATGGNLIFDGGLGVNAGGGFQMSGGLSTQGDGGGFTLTAGQGAGRGGNIIINGGYGGNAGGNFFMNGGESETLKGGSFFMRGGVGLNNDGGDIDVEGGTSDATKGGDVIFRSGTGPVEGKIKFESPQNSPAIFNTGGIEYKGFTTTQRDALTGLTGGRVIWNSTLSKLQVYNGSTWENLH